MSDAFTDMARENRRAELNDSYFRAVLNWLRNSDTTNFEDVISASSLITPLKPEDFRPILQAEMQKLHEGDKETWAKFLYRVSVLDDQKKFFVAFKKLSPFSDQLFVRVDYGLGFVTLGGEIEQAINHLVSQKGWKTHDCDKYAVSLPNPISKSEVFWTDCSISGLDGPRLVPEAPRPNLSLIDRHMIP